jgi:hypothetical protein
VISCVIRKGKLHTNVYSSLSVNQQITITNECDIWYSGSWNANVPPKELITKMDFAFPFLISGKEVVITRQTPTVLVLKVARMPLSELGEILYFKK